MYGVNINILIDDIVDGIIILLNSYLQDYHKNKLPSTMIHNSIVEFLNHIHNKKTDLNNKLFTNEKILKLLKTHFQELHEKITK